MGAVDRRICAGGATVGAVCGFFWCSARVRCFFILGSASLPSVAWRRLGSCRGRGYWAASALTFTQEILLWMVVWLASTVLLAGWEQLHERALQLQWNGAPVLLSTPVRTAWVVYLILVAAIALYTVNVSTPVLYQIF